MVVPARKLIGIIISQRMMDIEGARFANFVD